jgi:phage tail sheath protein FI
MPTLLHPGVYVSEVPSGARAIEGAPTSTTIFVGETERGPLGPTKITSRSDYERTFGGYFRSRGDVSLLDEPTRVLMTYAIDGFYLNGGSTAYILRACDGTPAPAKRGDVLAGSPGVWGNDLAVAFLPSSGTDATRFRIAVVYDPPDASPRRLVEVWDRLSIEPDDENYVVDVHKRSLYIRWDESVPVARPADDTFSTTTPKEDTIVAEAQGLTGGTGGAGRLNAGQYATLLASELAGVDDAALLVAAAEAMLDRNEGDYTQLVAAFIDFAEARPRQDLFFVGDLPRQSDTTSATDATNQTVAALGSGGVGTTSTFAGLYWPHVIVSDVAGVGRNPSVTLPPSGYVAGLFARNDGRRGVWKAPAGTEATLGSTIGLDWELNDLHSDELNPEGINALRQIPGAGRVVWGARTMVPSSEWRYGPVRRTAIFLRTSIYNGIQWAVFEPNDEPLWASLRTSIGSFMNIQFRNGAFAGRTADEAYLVKVDAETTTPVDQAAGIVNILVAFAPLRPAEFVVVKLSQKAQPVA